MNRPAWMEEDIEVIITDLGKEKDSDLMHALHVLPYDVVCNAVEKAWREHSANYSATWLMYKKDSGNGYYMVWAEVEGLLTK